MKQTYRDQFVWYVNTGTSDKSNYELEGHGVESLAISYNADIKTYKPIIQRNSVNTFNGYDMQSAVSKHIYKGDPVYEMINNMRRDGIALETDIIEVDTTAKESESYQAMKYDVLITMNEFLGENADISYDIRINKQKKGLATLVSGKPTFTPSVS